MIGKRAPWLATRVVAAPLRVALSLVGGAALAGLGGGCSFDHTAVTGGDSGGGGTDSGPAAVCLNGLDDDGDALTDFPEDPGCERPADEDEGGDPVTQCNDGIDNDGDGATDFPDDLDCFNGQDDDEATPVFAQCENGLDDDGDGLIDFFEDPGCDDFGDDDETDGPPPACSDMVDNDGDALIDFPDDPGCAAAGDTDETDGATAACANGLDDDGDALTDFPADPGCTSAGDTDETDPPADCGGVGFSGDLSVTGVAAGTTMGTSDFAGSCAGTVAPEDIYTFDLPYAVDSFIIDSGGSLNSALYVRTTCDDDGTEIGCNAFGMTPTLFFGTLAPGTYFLFVDGDSGATGPYTVSLAGEWPAFGECVAGHAFIDCPTGQMCSDPGSGFTICNEGACRDTFDNDADALTDFPFDPGCTGPTDSSEVDPAIPTACSNTVDDDGDALADFPDDAGCSSASDDDESGCGYDFDTGLQGWTVSNSDAVVGWVVDSSESFTPANALYYGDPATLDYDSGMSSNSGTATSPLITLSAGTPEVTFFVWLDVEGLMAFDTLVLRVLPAGDLVWDRNDFPQGVAGQTGGQFIAQLVDLSAYAGMAIQLEFEFDTIDGILNDGVGVYIDSVSIDGTCP